LIIGVDPHKLSATIEVVDHREQLPSVGAIRHQPAGYAAMRRCGEVLAGESVVEVPAKLAARVRALRHGHIRKPSTR
jgi:hypothetical protein